MRKIVLLGLLSILLVSITFPTYAFSTQTDISAKGWDTFRSLLDVRGDKRPKAATGINGSAPPDPELRWALIIGISDYAPVGEGGPDLRYCDEDALDVNKTLVEKYGYLISNIILLLDGNATKEWIMGNITLLKGWVEEGYEVVFSFSGHGTKGKGQSGIIAHDRAPIWNKELAEAFAGFKTNRICFIFDSCYSGGMDGVAAPGRVVCMAAIGLAWESSEWENGQFTYYFVDQGMYSGLADANGDGYVTVEEAFDYAVANCKMQRPKINDQFENDMQL